MSSKRVFGLLLASAVVTLTGCNTAHTHIGDEDPFLGEAVKYNAAIQTVNPTPVYPPNAAQPGGNGAEDVAAVKRYRTGTVKQPEATQTTMGSASSGGPH